MLKVLQWFLSLFFVFVVLILFVGCGSPNLEQQEKSIAISVPLVQDCSRGIPPGAQQFTVNGQCVVFNAVASQMITLPYAQSDIESIKLILVDPQGGKHEVGNLNGDINTIQSGVGQYLWITDVNNPSLALARLSIRGSQAFVEINLNDGSNTIGNIYQSNFQNQMVATMELVIKKKK